MSCRHHPIDSLAYYIVFGVSLSSFGRCIATLIVGTSPLSDADREELLQHQLQPLLLLLLLVYVGTCRTEIPACSLQMAAADDMGHLNLVNIIGFFLEAKAKGL